MEVMLIDGKPAELAKSYSRYDTYSPFRYRVLRNGMLIGNGVTAALAIADTNKRLTQMGLAKPI
jgi:hypothetical protein